MTNAQSTKNTLSSPGFLIFYRTFLAFIVGYFCTQLFNFSIFMTAHLLGLAKAESLVIGAIFSIIFGSIFVLACYITLSLKKLFYRIIILTTILIIIRFYIFK